MPALECGGHILRIGGNELNGRRCPSKPLGTEDQPSSRTPQPFKQWKPSIDDLAFPISCCCGIHKINSSAIVRPEDEEIGTLAGATEILRSSAVRK
jgi:hypothetical protein